MPRPKQPLQWAKGATQIAAAIKANFGIECARQHIVNWKKLHPPFPSSDDAGRYKIEECFEWVRLNKAPNPITPEQADIFEKAMRAKAENTITDAETAKRKLAILDNLYIEKSLSRMTLVGVVRTIHSFIRAELERNSTQARRDKLKEIGVAPEHIIAFCDFDLKLAIDMMDRVERKCADV